METQSSDVKAISKQFSKTIEPSLWLFFEERNSELAKQLNALKQNYENLQKSIEETESIAEKIEIQREFKGNLLERINENSGILNSLEFHQFFDKYCEVASKEITEIKRLVTKKELFNGYSLSIKDNPLLTLRKIFVNFWRATRLLSKRFINPFRKLFRLKPLEVVVYRKRKILLRNLANHFLKNVLVKGTIPLVNKLMESQSKALIAIWAFDEELNDQFQKILQPLENGQVENTDVPEEISDRKDIFTIASNALQISYEDIKAEISQVTEKTFSKFNQAFQIVDTLDLPLKTYSRNSFLKKQKQVSTLSKVTTEAWRNTHQTLFDDWSLDVEITLLYYSVFDQFNLLGEKIESFIEDDLSKNFNDIRDFIGKSQKLFEKTEGYKELSKTFASERKRVATELIDKTLSKAIEKLTTCFADDFEVFIQDVLKLVEDISESRSFLRHKGYSKPSNNDEVKSILPRELLNFEALPELIQKVKDSKEFTASQLEKARMNLMGLGTVCDFSLETASIMISQKEKPEEAIEAATEGYSRALNHLEKVEAILQNIKDSVFEELSGVVNRFNSNIEKLKDTENIVELNLKIARIKAVERTNRYKREAVLLVKNIIPKIIEGYRKLKTVTLKKYEGLKLSMGFSPPKKYVSFELSEFISQSQYALKKLPFVYQRLYQLSPTDEERFFVNREKELEKLVRSYDNWKKDRFITVAIIGEKGSGVTSLINLFLRKTQISIPIVKHTLNYKIHALDQYYNFFASLLDVDKFETNEQIIEHLNSLDKGRVIILENLQHMYLKQVHGFDCMNMLFDLMANTMKKVLWIGAYTTHSWNYLNKTIHVANYFTNEIYVEPLNQNTIEEIIFKRNSLSGFQILFQPGENDLSSKNFVKLSDDEKQAYLRKQFFTNLHNLSHGNISLAQLYWLRSTNEVTDDYISISAISQIDFNFIGGLPADDLFALQAMILHDGLTLEDFSMVIGKNLGSCRNMLTPMLEKGLLIKPKSKYNVNPIIFGAVASYLSSRNFIN